jgi:hypothetical protein
VLCTGKDDTLEAVTMIAVAHQLFIDTLEAVTMIAVAHQLFIAKMLVQCIPLRSVVLIQVKDRADYELVNK